MKKRKAFTLIELLAVIVILGLIIAIAIPSITKYITQSRKKTLTTTIGNYTVALIAEVNDMKYTFTDSNSIYAIPIECIDLESGGTNPFGEWYQSSDDYWAYVLVQYDDKTSSYTYGFTFKDSAGYGLYPITIEKMNENGNQIVNGLTLNQPKNGLIINTLSLDKWKGFKVNENTRLNVLESASENSNGDGISTCTLLQKGDNYNKTETIKENKYKIGREICIDKECFNIISSDTNTVTMLAKEKIDLLLESPRQNPNAGEIKIANSSYWTKEGALKEKYGTGFPAYLYDENSNIYKYVEAYELYLQSLGLKSVSAKLISHEQIQSIKKANKNHEKNWLLKPYIWHTGSFYTTGHAYFYRSDGYIYANWAFVAGVRPVITIDKIDFVF